jgi:hypothetical protein
LDKGREYFGGAVISESSQWVLLDEFDSLAKIPLDEYSQRVSSFDPRNDGYAEKLRNMFVHGGRRFVYIPLKAGNSVPSLFEKQLKKLLGNISFTVTYYGRGRPIAIFLILFSAAALCLIIICCVQKKYQLLAAGVIPLLPLVSLASFGAPGIAAAALLVGMSAMLREPLNELNTLLRLPLAGAEKRRLFFKDIFEPYRLYWLTLPVFALAMGVIVFFSALPFLFVITVSIIFCGLFFFSIRTFSLLSGSHRRFIPVLIIKNRFPDFAFSVYMLPFVIAAFSAVLVTQSVSGALISSGNPGQMVNEQEYYDHLTFQSTFSVRQLGKPGGAYPSYRPDNSGLPGLDAHAVTEPLYNDFPPFPLKNIVSYSSGDAGRSTDIQLPGNVSLLILLVFIVPLFLQRRTVHFTQKNRFAVSGGFHLKLRHIGISRKKSLLYNSKNIMRIRKDA